MADKIFIGRASKDKWGNAKISFNAEDIEKLKSNLDNDKVTVVVKESQKNPGTFYGEVDLWKPKNGQA